ncbi:hypothetical protein [Acerihabitans arboris]|uniref:DUF3990 domain-containing protein n=1 Tax=Acerihabitans arboris TaxID=2691583 RepID=A0A845SKG5_9GAMM|nr:hypothetical protein [Acerihabitans arboris]NDL63737.1 hypothetical protein [Acerihabitans arboris]
MYNTKTSFVYGFHGTDENIAFEILNGKRYFKVSKNNYDWLGDGTYFWENNFERAKQYADETSRRGSSTVKRPFVLGAVIDLGNCLDLLNQKHLDHLALMYENFKEDVRKEKKFLPSNQSFISKDTDFKKRELDCAVIRWAHNKAKFEGSKFDTVRAAFWEGKELYPNAGFREQNHIQIAVINPNCIKGIFLPRNKDMGYHQDSFL